MLIADEGREMAEVKCEVFGFDPGAIPNVEDLLSMTDPENLRQLYSAAGLEMLADNIAPLQRAATARQRFVELPLADYEALR